MTLRKVPAAVALGLLASLAAHAAVYGREHAVGGNQHALLLEIAAGALVALVSAALLLAWSGARMAMTGSVLSARLTCRLPGFVPLLGSTVLWYAGIERLEPQHADASLLSVGLSLVVAAWLVARLCRRLCAVLAKTILSIAAPPFNARTFAWFVSRTSAPLRRRILPSHRRFARPPPIGSFAGA